MAIIDAKLELSDGQAVTGDAASTNVIDLGPNWPDLGKGLDMAVVADVSEDFATLDSLQVSIEDSADNASFAKIVHGADIAASDLKVGKRLLQAILPPGHRRYVRLYFTVTGSDATAGKVNAYFTPTPQTA